MGQYDVFEYLKKNKGKWLSQKDVYKAFSNVSSGSVYISLKKLVKSNVVEMKLTRIDKPNTKRKDYFIKEFRYVED